MRLRALLVTLAALWSTAAWSERAPDLIGRWVGTLHTLAGTCPDQRASTLVVDRRELSFAPADGVLVLRGLRQPDGVRLHAQLNLPGLDHKPVPMVFEAHPDGTSIAGRYGTPACRAEIRLRRPSDRSVSRTMGG